MDFDFNSIWFLLAGLSLFLFGIYIMEDALKLLIGRSFKKFLHRFTKYPLPAILTGVSITAMLQSSSMVILLVMSFAGAGIMGLNNGIGVILGANLGTTFTGWLVTLLGFKLNIELIVLPLLGGSGLAFVFIKHTRINQIFRFLLGFSLLFLGLSYMKDSFSAIAQNVDLTILANRPLILFFLFGFVLTALIQSSSASMLIFLSSLSAGIIDYQQIMYLVVGSDLGTSVTAIIGTIKGNTIKKRIGWSQFIFNFFSSGMALLMIPLYYKLIVHHLRMDDPLFATVTFHSVFNLVGIICVAPFLKYFTQLIIFLVPEKSQYQSKFIVHVNPQETHAAIQALHKEVLRFLYQSISVNRKMMHIEHSPIPHIESYMHLKSYESEITSFYRKMVTPVISEQEGVLINSLITVVRNATLSVKDMKDISHTIDELSNSGNDTKYSLFIEIRQKQQRFYSDIQRCIDTDGLLNDKSLKIFESQIKESHLSENQQVITAKDDKFLDLPSLFNLIREISNSNESILRSLTHLMLYIDEFDK